MRMLILNSIVMQQFDKLIFVRLKIKKAQWLLSVKKFNKYRKKNLEISTEKNCYLYRF